MNLKKNKHKIYLELIKYISILTFIEFDNKTVPASGIPGLVTYTVIFLLIRLSVTIINIVVYNIPKATTQSYHSY